MRIHARADFFLLIYTGSVSENIVSVYPHPLLLTNLRAGIEQECDRDYVGCLDLPATKLH